MQLSSELFTEIVDAFRYSENSQFGPESVTRLNELAYARYPQMHSLKEQSQILCANVRVVMKISFQPGLASTITIHPEINPSQRISLPLEVLSEKDRTRMLQGEKNVNGKVMMGYEKTNGATDSNFHLKWVAVTLS